MNGMKKKRADSPLFSYSSQGEPSPFGPFGPFYSIPHFRLNPESQLIES